VASGYYWFLHQHPHALPPLKERQLTTNSDESPVQSARISPDGKYLAYSDLQGIHLKLIETGETRLVAQPQSINGVTLVWYVNSWFPDGSRFLASGYQPGVVGGIWFISLMGGQPRKLSDDAYAWAVSPDGGSLFYTSKAGAAGGRDIGIMNADGQGVRKVVQEDEHSEYEHVVWSPDGLRFAYLKLRETPNNFQTSVETRDLSSGASSTIASIPGVTDLIWLPDGRLLLSQQESSDANTCNLWQIRLDLHGRALRPPERLTNWSGFCAIGMTASTDGKRLSFQKASWKGSVYVAELGPNGTIRRAPERLTRNDSGNSPMDWTPDNRSVLFTSDRNGQNQLFEQSLQSDSPEIVMNVSDASIACISPDGAWVLVSSPKGADFQTMDISRTPITGGSSQIVATAHTAMFGANTIRCSRAPASLCAIAEQPYDRKQIIFFELDPLKGRGKEFLRFETDPSGIYQWALSPDSTRMAVMNPKEGKVHVLHLDGRPTEEIVVKNSNLGDAFDYAADNNGFFIDYSTPHGTALAFLDLHGNTHKIWEQPGIVSPTLGLSTWGIQSRDGRHLAINGWTQSSNVWLLENF
jgi:Tol biopolymer transport system component